MDDTRSVWDEWSDDFQSAWNAETEGDDLPPAPIHYGPGFPEDERLDFLPSLDGATVAELGCGGGQASVGFARRATETVIGVDFSGEQLRHARELAEAYNVHVQFALGDVSSLPIPRDAVDLAFSSWVYHMIADLETAFAEADRVLRPGGIFVFAIPHPFYALFDPDDETLAGSYFDDTPARKSIGDIEPDLVEYHRSVGEVYDTLVDAGFRVDRIYEPGTTDEDAYREQWSHKPALMTKVPPTLVMRAIAE